ncbi:hypothetical protein [Sagittula salina]|uniref:SH3 domain-containing protein n=1 Tax=Sagittula salina TaxID=2820268 RepID=A0A940MLR4_9RHOB|nr:hypothetical protein [Sagittula salina]MBP0481042.1 hypothetical protein [Sagittula salina]
MAPSLDIRASAAPDAPIVARVTKHRHLEVLQGIAKLVGERARRRACAQACRGYGDVLLRQEDPLEWARDKMAAAACMAENVIWWNVALPDGRSGWVSAKDLR